MLECDFKEYIDFFYSEINKCRTENGLNILSEDQCVSNQILEQVIKGQQSEYEDKRMIYKKCGLFCDENDFILSKQNLQMNQYSQNRQDVEEAIRFLFNQIYLDNQKEIKQKKILTHMKLFILKTQNDQLKSCLTLSAKPLQIIEFSYDTLMDQYFIFGQLNRAISQEAINLYAIKITDSYNMKVKQLFNNFQSYQCQFMNQCDYKTFFNQDVVIGPGRGQIDENLNFTFNIPSQIINDIGIQTSNKRCELEFYHKIDAEIQHYQHFAFKTVDIDHSYQLIMKQPFLPVYQGRVRAMQFQKKIINLSSIYNQYDQIFKLYLLSNINHKIIKFLKRKSRKDSPDIRRSNSLFKNRLSSSCNKENRIPDQNLKQNSTYKKNQSSGGDQFFSQQYNQTYTYHSEKRNNERKSQAMDSIWEGNENDFSIYKDDIFRSNNQKMKTNNKSNSQKQQKQMFSFGETDSKFFRDNIHNNQLPQTPFLPSNNSKQSYQSQNYIPQQQEQINTFNNTPFSSQLTQPNNNNNTMQFNTVFQNPPQKNSFNIQQPSYSAKLGGVTSQSLPNQQSIFSSSLNNNSQNLFSNQSTQLNNSIFNNSNSSQTLFPQNNQSNDIWKTNKRDLFQNEIKQENKSLQQTNIQNTNIFQTGNIDRNMNNNSSQNIFNSVQTNQQFPIVQQLNIQKEQVNLSNSLPQLSAQNIIQNSTLLPLLNQSIQTTQNSLIQNNLPPAQPIINMQQNNQIPLVQQSLIQQAQQQVLPNPSILRNQDNNENLFSESERLYYKGIKHTFTQFENLAKLKQGQEHKIPSNKERKQKALLDSRSFKDPSKKIQKLKEIEKGFTCCKEPLKSDYQKYWNTGEHCDFTLTLESVNQFKQTENKLKAYFKLHKVVVGHYSEYFRKIFSEQKITNFQLKQNNFNSEAVRLIFKWMYFNELPIHEWEDMSFKQAQQTLNCALYIKTWEFLVQVLLFEIIKVIIPKMTSDKLIYFLILSEYLLTYFSKRKDDDSLNLVFGAIKLLQNYCILYFSNNSIEVIEKTEDIYIQFLIESNSDLIFSLVNETCLKFDTLEHLERLFNWLNKQAPMYFGRNIVELCSFFESQYLDIQPFDKVYMAFDKEIKSLKPQFAFTTPYFDKTPNATKGTPSKSALKKQNDMMIDEIEAINTEIEDILLTKQKWPSSNLLKPPIQQEQASQRDFIFSRSSDFTFQFKRPDIPTVFISEEFYSFSRKWRIIITIDSGEEQNFSNKIFIFICRVLQTLTQFNIINSLSIYLRESGQRSQKEFEMNLYNERILFTSVLTRVEFQERKSCSFDMFYSYANNQNITVGRRKFCSAKRIADPQTHNIKLKIWIEELKCHSGLMHFISQKLSDFLISGFNEDQKKQAQNQIEQSNKKHMGNNEPVSNKRQSQRVMDALLDKEWAKITAQMDEEGKILSPIKTRMSVNRTAKEKFSIKSKELSLFSLPVFEGYYILSSDNLNINNEKYAVHLIYCISLNKSDMEIDLLLHGVRFSYLELEKMLDLARDHNSIKGNKYFQMMIEKELNQRFEMYQDKVIPLQKGRNNYDYAQFYKNQNKMSFKQNFLNWLFNSEHHQGFKNEIQKIQTAMRNQMDELKQKEQEITQQFMKLKQEKQELKIQQFYSQNIGQKMPIISTMSTNPSINSGSFSSSGSFDENLQRKNMSQPSRIVMEPNLIYNQNGQPLLNLSQQERQRMQGGISLNNNSLPYISSSRAVEKDTCVIF